MDMRPFVEVYTTGFSNGLDVKVEGERFGSGVPEFLECCQRTE